MREMTNEITKYCRFRKGQHFEVDSLLNANKFKSITNKSFYNSMGHFKRYYYDHDEPDERVDRAGS